MVPEEELPSEAFLLNQLNKVVLQNISLSMTTKFIDYILCEAKNKSLQMGDKVSTQMCLMNILSFFVEKRSLDTEARNTS